MPKRYDREPFPLKDVFPYSSVVSQALFHELPKEVVALQEAVAKAIKQENEIDWESLANA